ncbi:MAG: ParA family protein [Phycisphaerales bacterium]
MRTLAVVNQKGGCGKTTTAINLAAVLARGGARTLIVDMDPQGHCAAGLGIPESSIECSVAEALLADPATFDPGSLLWEVSRNLRLAPASLQLAALESAGGGLASRPDRDLRLSRLLARLAAEADWCIIDCPPTIGLLTFNALRAAGEALVPVETGFFALRGAERQVGTIQALAPRLGREIPIRMLPSMHRGEAKVAAEVLAALARRFPDLLLPVIIREHEVLREAASFGQAAVEFAPESAAHEDFRQLAEWLHQHPVPPVDLEAATAAGAAVPPRAVNASVAALLDPPEGGAAAEPPRTSQRAAELVARMRVPPGSAEAAQPAPPSIEGVAP